MGSEIVLRPEAETKAGWIANLPSVHVRKDQILELVERAVSEEKRSSDACQQAQLDLWSQEVREKDARIAELEADLLDMRDACGGLQQDLQVEKNATNSLEARLDETEKERDALKAEVARLHGLLERADAELPPENPVQQEVSRTLQSCSDVVEGLRDQVFGLTRELYAHKADLAAARKQIEGMKTELSKAIHESESACYHLIRVLNSNADREQAARADARAWLATAPEGGDRG